MLTDGQYAIGETPLHSAARYNRCEVAQILIAAGADLNAKTKVMVPCMPLAVADNVLTDGQIGWTPLGLAKKIKSQEMVKLLEAAGAR